MRSPRHLRASLAASSFSLIASATSLAGAASLEPVSGWEINGLPEDVSMYAYVPDAVVDNPPLVVLIHYCGGTAPAVFGQAQGGGLVAAADQYGFIIIAPSSGRCWDVVSNQTHLRDGGGDSHAIRQMVTHALDIYDANSDRVYATGNSSGGMMTQLLLGLYPDVFKGGSAMAGMPAGCRGDNESGDGGGYSGACAGANVDRTPEEWGAIVESLSPNYDGLRPRVQLFHGDADDLIRYDNHTEAIEEWSYVLELPDSPDEELTNLTLGTHDGIRETWIGECGLPVLDALTSLGGDHGPSDALFLAEYLVPFLGLDQVGPVDPYVEACEALNPGGTGGGNGAGGTNDGTGGSEATGGNGGMPLGTGGALTGTGGAGAGGPETTGGASNAGTGGAIAGPGSGGETPASEPLPSEGRSSNSSGPGGCSQAGSRARPLAMWLTLFAAAVLARRRRRPLCN